MNTRICVFITPAFSIRACIINKVVLRIGRIVSILYDNPLSLLEQLVMRCIAFTIISYIYIYMSFTCQFSYAGGWSGGAMVLAKLSVPGRPTNLD